jgi:hypothetical protein
MEDREGYDWEEQELRAKLMRDQEQRRAKEHGSRNNQREETGDPRGKNKGP